MKTMKKALICVIFFNLCNLCYCNLCYSQSNNGVVIDKIIAKIDNQIILKSELEISYLQYTASPDFVGAGSEAVSENLKCELFESLIINKILLAKAEIDSVTVENKVVADQLNRRMEFFIAQIGSEEKLEEFYDKSIEELKNELRKQVKEQLILQKMQNNITQKIKITPAEVKKFFNKIPRDSLPYFSTEVEVAQIVRFPQVSREQKIQAKIKLKKIRERILNGEDFVTLAKEYSEDPGSAKLGGELGFWKIGELAPEYEAAALNLKPSEISKVTESQFGFHVIQLIERRGNEYNSRHILIKPNSSVLDIELPEHYLDSIRALILADSMMFEKAAKEFSEDQATNSNGGFLFDANTGSTKLPLDQIDPVIFFTIDTMKTGTISPPVSYKTQDGKEALRIIWYKSRIPPHQANLKQDYQKIYTATLDNKKNQALADWIEKTKAEVFIDIDEEYGYCDLMN